MHADNDNQQSDLFAEKSPEELTKDRYKAARKAAYHLLSRREYSARELSERLLDKGHEAGIIAALLDDLKRENLQNDHRFAEAYCRSRQHKGFGPLRIKQELQQKGIDAELINQTLNDCDEPWEQWIETVRVKRFGHQLPRDSKSIAKQIRFLQYRGFPPELVHWLMRHGAEFAE